MSRAGEGGLDAVRPMLSVLRCVRCEARLTGWPGPCPNCGRHPEVFIG